MLGRLNQRDLLASVVVFLVALPLCLGIAIASGVPPARGLVCGIIGGIITGFLAGAPLQVSGPAAGLAVLVYEFVQAYGLEWLGPAVLGAGLLQWLAGRAGFGRAFQAVSPAVIKGMLAGIGVLIFGSQFHVMVDDAPRKSGLMNLLTIPEAILKGLPEGIFNAIPQGLVSLITIDSNFEVSQDALHHQAAAIGLMTLLIIVLWEKFRPNKLQLVPAPLVAVIVATLVTAVVGLQIQKVQVPTDFSSFVELPSLGIFDTFTPAILFSIVAIAFIASAETLLCATAVDALHDGERCDYNQELKAQGVGNMCCGFLGALPMTGVIVRSSANIKAGAETKQSAILHGIWLGVLVFAFPAMLGLIPTACLAAILVYIGYRLVDVKAMKNLKKYSNWELAIYLVTLSSIVAFDLLTGVVAGIILALLRIISNLAHLDISVDHDSSGQVDVRLAGAATFISLPKIASVLGSIEREQQVRIHLDKLLFLDHACLEAIQDFHKLYERQGGKVILEWSMLDKLSADDRIRLVG